MHRLNDLPATTIYRLDKISFVSALATVVMSGAMVAVVGSPQYAMNTTGWLMAALIYTCTASCFTVSIILKLLNRRHSHGLHTGTTIDWLGATGFAIGAGICYYLMANPGAL